MYDSDHICIKTVPEKHLKQKQERFCTNLKLAPIRWPDHCPSTRSVLHGPIVFIVAIAAVPCRSLNNLPPLATRCRKWITYLTCLAYTCWRHAKEPLNQLKYTIRVNITYCSRWVVWQRDSCAISKHCWSVKHPSHKKTLFTAASSVISPYLRHLRVRLTACTSKQTYILLASILLTYPTTRWRPKLSSMFYSFFELLKH